MSTADLKNRNRTSAVRQEETQRLIGEEMSFAAKEAYKLLRTNLSYILNESEKEGCKIIGMTSSLRGEGKSTTSINLAYVLAEMDKRVLLVEADMRLPSLRKKMHIPSKNGLSNVLVRRVSALDFVQKININRNPKKQVSFDVLVSGDVPPNPSELLASNRMLTVLEELSGAYDYIVLDLPPVTAVADALVATRLVDGLIMVVRSDYADRGSLNETMRQIQMVNGKVLGFVLTCANTASTGYGKKKYKKYKYYYRDYR